MVALAAGLKKNAEAMKQAVARREGLLSETEDAVEDSLVKAKKSSKESKSLKVKCALADATWKWQYASDPRLSPHVGDHLTFWMVLDVCTIESLEY